MKQGSFIFKHTRITVSTTISGHFCLEIVVVIKNDFFFLCQLLGLGHLCSEMHIFDRNDTACVSEAAQHAHSVCNQKSVPLHTLFRLKGDTMCINTTIPPQDFSNLLFGVFRPSQHHRRQHVYFFIPPTLFDCPPVEIVL